MTSIAVISIEESFNLFIQTTRYAFARALDRLHLKKICRIKEFDQIRKLCGFYQFDNSTC